MLNVGAQGGELIDPAAELSDAPVVPLERLGGGCRRLGIANRRQPGELALKLAQLAVHLSQARLEGATLGHRREGNAHCKLVTNATNVG